MARGHETKLKAILEPVKVLLEFVVGIGIIVGFIRGLLASPIEYSPVIVAIAGFIVGVTALVGLGLILKLRLLRIVGSLFFNLESMVVSVLVFDGKKVLLVEDNERQPPWLVPPSAHVGCFTKLKGAPYQAVVRAVKDEAGIDIKIDGPGGGTAAVTPIALPFFAQSEDQSRWEGHANHHDLYYLGHLNGQRKIINIEGNYEWIDMKNVGQSPSTKTPDEMKAIIDLAYNVQRRTRVSS